MRMMICVTALALGSAALAAEDKKGDTKPVTDAEFVMMAASGDMFEIESSKLALGSTTSGDVKKFAEQMVADHTKSSKELAEVAKKANLALPTKMTDEHAKLLEQLRGAKGNLDRAYLDSQVTAHKQAVALYTSAAKGAKDPGLKAFAEKTLPVVTAHYEHVQKHGKGR